MRAMFPQSGGSGGVMESLRTHGRQVVIIAGAVVALVALALFRAEVRSSFKSLLGKPEAEAPNPALARAHARAAAKKTPGAAAVAQTGKPAAPASQPAATKPAAVAAAPAAKPAASSPATTNLAVTNAATTNPAATKPAATKPASSPAASNPAATSPAATKAAGPSAVPVRDTAKPAPAVMREAYDYSGTSRRDPFVSLLSTGELRPTITDLKLMGILYDESGRHPVAIMRDAVSNAQYRVTNGQQLGRMRVARIKPRVVVFTIEEFGMSRQDSLVLGDTTKARAR